MIAQDTVTAVVGYSQEKTNNPGDTKNLPQRIAVFGEANTANQTSIDISPFIFTNSFEVGKKYGWGSPLHLQAQILRPSNENLLGGIETIIYPQLEDVAATATAIKRLFTVATTVTETATHTIVINDRRFVGDTKYDFIVKKGDAQADVTTAVLNCIANALYSPVTATLSTFNIDFTTKWKGATSAELSIEFDDNGIDAGIVYGELSKTLGVGAVDITPSLALFDNAWNTILINPYGSSEFDELESYNGVPGLTPTGRYASDVYKPLESIFGTNITTKAAAIAITDVTARKEQLTNVAAVAPGSNCFCGEIASNLAVVIARIANEGPHRGYVNEYFHDLPVIDNVSIGDFADHSERDAIVKIGCSTTIINGGKYQIKDVVTTYHPDGDTTPAYRFVRDNILLWNIEYACRIIMMQSIWGKTIVENNQSTRVTNTISPSQAKALMNTMLDDLEVRALINDAAKAKESVTAEVKTSPRRLDITFPTEITSIAAIVTAVNYFNFSYISNS